jgi:hypothetical protein
VNDEGQLSECLKAVAEAAAEGEEEIDAARLMLKERESQVGARIATLVLAVARVVFASNSQALHQKAVRGLYWGARIKAGIIAEAFGVNEHAIHSIAGPLVEQTPCEGGCGKQVEHTYRSHSDWRSGGRNSKHRIPHLCGQCQAKHDALGRIEYEQYQAKQRAEAVAYCAQYGHHWGAEDIDGVRPENGVDWISNNRPIRLEGASLVSIDNKSIVLQLFCMNWCGATLVKRISGAQDAFAVGGAEAKKPEETESERQPDRKIDTTKHRTAPIPAT